MSQNLSSQSPIRPLSVGNVVNAGFRLYGAHYQSYLGVALRGTLWSLLPVLIFIPCVLLIINSRLKLSYLWLIIPIWLIFGLYCAAKYLTNSALISRLAFGELINQPESIKVARSHVEPRMWLFLKAAILIFLLGVAIYLCLFFLFLFIGFLSGLIIGADFVRAVLVNIGAQLFLGLLSLFIGLAVLYALAWVFTHFLIVEMPLAIENNINAVTAISRSWNLCQGNVWRIILIVIVAFLIAIPMYLIIQMIASLFRPIIASLVPINTPPFVIFSYVMAHIVGRLGSIVIVPFWQTIKAVIYYDLRIRREGLGLQLRDREV